MVALKDELLALEREYWDGVKAKDSAVAARLTGDSVVYVGESGVALMKRDEIASTAEAADAEVVAYRFSEPSVTVMPIGPETAVIAYEVTRTNRRDGRTSQIKTFDSTVWSRGSGRWQAVMHTETPAPTA